MNVRGKDMDLFGLMQEWKKEMFEGIQYGTGRHGGNRSFLVFFLSDIEKIKSRHFQYLQIFHFLKKYDCSRIFSMVKHVYSSVGSLRHRISDRF